MSQALYRKWRPKTWSEVVGQDHIVQTLKNAISTGRVGHAYLFSGPRGTGKTTTARLLAKAVNCLGPDDQEKPCDACQHCLAVDNGNYLDLIEIDAASNTSVEDVRDLRDKINFSPNSGKYKVYIIDEVHMLSTAAFNALLKTLEEPPSHAIFILATTEIHKIPATVLSRCQRHEFRRLSVPVMVDLLKKKANEEGFEIEPEVFLLVARQATGSLRDGISLLDQLTSSNQKVTLELADTVLGTATSTSVVNLTDYLIARNLAEGLNQIQKALDTGTDARQLARQIVEYLRNILLVKSGNRSLVDVAQEVWEVMVKQADLFSQRDLLDSINQFNLAAGDSRSSSWQPGLALELAFARSIQSDLDVNRTREKDPPIQKVGRSARVEKEKSASEPVVQQDLSPKTDHVVSTKEEMIESVEIVSEDTTDIALDNPMRSGTSDHQLIQQNWRKIIETVRKLSPGTQALVNSCHFNGIKDGCVRLVFASDLIKTKMESNDHLDITSKAIQQVTGLSMSIRCEVTSVSTADISQDKQAGQESLVGSALRELGGQVVNVQDVNENEKPEVN